MSKQEMIDVVSREEVERIIREKSPTTGDEKTKQAILEILYDILEELNNLPSIQQEET